MPKKEAPSPRKSSMRPPNSPRTPYRTSFGSVGTSPTGESGQTTFPVRTEDGKIISSRRRPSTFGFSHSAQPYDRYELSYDGADYRHNIELVGIEKRFGTSQYDPRPRGPGQNVYNANRLWRDESNVNLGWIPVVLGIILIILVLKQFMGGWGVQIKKSNALKQLIMRIKVLLDSYKIKLTQESILDFINSTELEQEQKNVLFDLFDYSYTELVEFLDNEGMLDHVLSINPYDLVDYIKSLSSTVDTVGMDTDEMDTVGMDTLGMNRNEVWVRGAKKRKSKKRKGSKRH
jgi:hypothetical protein